jgi:hypothetical protein
VKGNTVICSPKYEDLELSEIIQSTGLKHSVKTTEEVIDICVNSPKMHHTFNIVDGIDTAILMAWGEAVGIIFSIEDNKLHAKPI